MAPMPPAWLAVEDEESGAMYFYHERTGRTTWEHPADRCASCSGTQLAFAKGSFPSDDSLAAL